MSGGLNLNALRDQIKKGKSVIYSNSTRENSTPFFSLWKDEGWNSAENQYEAIVRLVVRPGTQGFGFRVMHKRVGYPGKDPKSFTCPKFMDPNAECVLCDAVALGNNPELDLKNQFIDWPERKDGVPVLKPKSVYDILQMIAPEQRLIFMVVEPKYLNNKNAKPALQGLQAWFVEKRTLIKKILDIMKHFPEHYFTDPENGASLMVTFKPKAPALEMYNVIPYRVEPVPVELVNSAPDAETFTSKVRNNQEMIDKLREMLPGVDL